METWRKLLGVVTLHDDAASSRAHNVEVFRIPSTTPPCRAKAWRQPPPAGDLLRTAHVTCRRVGQCSSFAGIASRTLLKLGMCNVQRLLGRGV